MSRIIRIGCVLVACGSVFGGCVESEWPDAEDDGENVSHVEQSLDVTQFAPSGSNISFIGIYRMKILGDCLNQSGAFLPCTNNDANLSEQFAIYQGADANYHLCAPSPPRLVDKEYCTAWDYNQGPGGSVWPYCVESAIGRAYEATCMYSGSGSGSTVSAVTTDLSVKDQGAPAFVRTNAEVIAMATATPNVFVLKSSLRNSAGTEKRIYFRDANTNAVGLSKSTSSDNAKPNRQWVPIRVPYPGPVLKIRGK